MSNDNRYMFFCFCENGSRISVIDLSKKDANKIGEIGLVQSKDVITSISISDNLLVFGGERGTVGVFFLCLLQNAKSVKIARKRKLSKPEKNTTNVDNTGMYPGFKLVQGYQQEIEDITISADEKSVVLCGKRKVQCYNVALKKKKIGSLMKKSGKEQLKIIKEIIKLKENAKLVATYGKQVRFNKKKSDMFCLCDDGQNTVTFKVYSIKNNGSSVKLMDSKIKKGKKHSFGSQVQFMNKTMCIIAYQTKSAREYDTPKCFVWKYKNKMQSKRWYDYILDGWEMGRWMGNNF
eukprot:550461_1